MHRSYSAGNNVRQEIKVRPKSSPNLDRGRISTPDLLMIQEASKRKDHQGVIISYSRIIIFE